MKNFNLGKRLACTLTEFVESGVHVYLDRKTAHAYFSAEERVAGGEKKIRKNQSVAWITAGQVTGAAMLRPYMIVPIWRPWAEVRNWFAATGGLKIEAPEMGSGVEVTRFWF